jgi:GNAT superfamily N-acetyltransferase
MSITFSQTAFRDKQADAAYAPAQTVTGSSDLLISQSVDPDDLRHLLETLAQEDCAHSWKNFGPTGTLDALARWENEQRPTQLFFFYVRRGGKLLIVAASAVADRLIGDFPHAGFCVLGRCYIMPEFRGQGLYRRILEFRLEYCRSRFGSALNAIHIGTDNERVGRTLMNHRVLGWPRFIHLGEQELHVENKIKMVGAYLLLLPAYVDKIKDALGGAHAPACVADLRGALAKMDAEDVRNLGAIIKQVSTQAREPGWFDGRDRHEIEKLELFCSCIPLVGF